MIEFNSIIKQYKWLSNFAPVQIMYEWKRYLSVEAAYQAAKCVKLDDKEILMRLTGSEARKFGRLVEVRPDWYEIKIPIMEKLLRYKFNYPDFKQKLLDTGDEKIVHLSPWDRFWGVNDNHRGQNKLGELIMKIREELKNDQK